MKENILARRYAKALYRTVASDGGDPEAMSEPLSELGDAMLADESLMTVWTRPEFSDDRKRALVDRLAERFELHDALRRLLIVMSQRERMPYLPFVAKAYRDIIEENGGTVYVTVTSAFEMDAAMTDKVRKALESWTGRTVAARYETDTELIGGVQVYVGDRRLDYTLAGMLERI